MLDQTRHTKQLSVTFSSSRNVYMYLAYFVAILSQLGRDHTWLSRDVISPKHAILKLYFSSHTRTIIYLKRRHIRHVIYSNFVTGFTNKVAIVETPTNIFLVVHLVTFIPRPDTLWMWDFPIKCMSIVHTLSSFNIYVCNGNSYGETSQSRDIDWFFLIF